MSVIVILSLSVCYFLGEHEIDSRMHYRWQSLFFFILSVVFFCSKMYENEVIFFKIIVVFFEGFSYILKNVKIYYIVFLSMFASIGSLIKSFN